MFQRKKKNEKKHDYDVTFDNVAIPEVHTHKTHNDTTENKTEQTFGSYDTSATPEISAHKALNNTIENKTEQASVNYDNLAIPEIHIKKSSKIQQ